MESMDDSDSSIEDDPFDFVDVIRAETSDDDLSPVREAGMLAETPAELPPGEAETISEIPAEHDGITPGTSGDQPPFVAEKPFHPKDDYEFPTRRFGKNQRRFKPKWCKTWEWLTYCIDKDSVLCFYCHNADRKGHLTAAHKKEDVFISKGFTNWKKATDRFAAHAKSECHRLAIEKLENTQDIGEKLSTLHASGKAENRRMLLKILGGLRFLARQSLPTRGEYVAGEGEENSNFIQLLKY